MECSEAVGASEVSSVLLLENHATVLNGCILNTFSIPGFMTLDKTFYRENEGRPYTVV